MRPPPPISPVLTAEQLVRLRAYGTPEAIRAGQQLFGPGDAAYDLMLVDAGEVSVIAPEAGDAPEEVVVRVGPDEFVGERGHITGAVLCPLPELDTKLDELKTHRTRLIVTV